MGYADQIFTVHFVLPGVARREILDSGWPGFCKLNTRTAPLFVPQANLENVLSRANLMNQTAQSSK